MKCGVPILPVKGKNFIINSGQTQTKTTLEIMKFKIMNFIAVYIIQPVKNSLKCTTDCVRSSPKLQFSTAKMAVTLTSNFFVPQQNYSKIGIGIETICDGLSCHDKIKKILKTSEKTQSLKNTKITS